MKKFDIDREAKRSSTLGLAAGMIVFLGLGGGFVYDGIADLCVNRFSGVEFWVRLAVGIFFLLYGLVLFLLGTVCLGLFKRRRKLKKQWKEMFKEGSHSA